MSFVPPSSIFNGSVSGTVAVSNFPADQLVHFVQPVSVTGPMTDAEFAAHLPLAVTGPATAADLASLATEETLERVNEQVSEVALTAAMQREELS